MSKKINQMIEATQYDIDVLNYKLLNLFNDDELLFADLLKESEKLVNELTRKKIFLNYIVENVEVDAFEAPEKTE